MESTRREFLERVTATAMLGALPSSVRQMHAIFAPPATSSSEDDEFDFSWVNRVTGKYKAVFDVPEIDSGYGVWRASIWAKQYMDFVKAAPEDLSAVLVLRHTGINLAMQQAYWDRYGVGKKTKAMHPITEQRTDRNPALLSTARGELPAMFDGVALDQLIAHGGIVLACNLALQDVADVIQKKDKVSAADARKQAIAQLVPGVILQPSGVFAALRAQDVGCNYLRAS
jgi:hypothetical protein